MYLSKVSSGIEVEHRNTRIPFEQHPYTALQATWDGRYVDLAALKPEDVDVRTVAHALARITRFVGHLAVPYSVASHALRVSLEVERETGDPRLALEGLHHDSHEAYLGDVTSPVKRLLALRGCYWPAVEAPVRVAVAVALDVPAEVDPVVKRVDWVMTYSEHAAFGHGDLQAWYGPEPCYEVPWPPVDPQVVEREFLERDALLRKQIGG